MALFVRGGYFCHRQAVEASNGPKTDDDRNQLKQWELRQQKAEDGIPCPTDIPASAKKAFEEADGIGFLDALANAEPELPSNPD